MQLPNRSDVSTQRGEHDGAPLEPTAWVQHLSNQLDESIRGVETRLKEHTHGGHTRPQFFNRYRYRCDASLIEVPIVWNAFPKVMVNLFGRDKAMQLADMPWHAGASIGAQNEYCEWRVERDAATQRIQRITFTVELKEYWETLFAISPSRVAALYSQLLGQPVRVADLVLANNTYDPRNRWNTSHGIVHLSRDENSLAAAIELCAGSTVRLQHVDGTVITHPEALCGFTGIGDPNRNSDTTAASTVNALARGGAFITVGRPAGFVIADVDTSGWALPCGIDPRVCLRIARGSPGRVLRLVVEMPHGCNHRLDQLTIAGVPLQYGGQIAECITVRSMLACTRPGLARPRAAVNPEHLLYIEAGNPRRLCSKKAAGNWLTAGQIPAFSAPPSPGPAASA